MDRPQSETDAEVIEPCGHAEPRGDRFRGQFWYAGKLRTSGTFDTREQCWRANRQLLAGLERNAPEGCPTLRMFAEQWFDRRELEEGVRHTSKEKSSWKQHVLSTDLADLPLDEIEVLDVHQWSRKRLRENKKRVIGGRIVPSTEKIDRKTVINALSILKRCLDDAVVYGHVKRNVARDVVMSRPDKISDDVWTFLTLPEIGQLLTSNDVALHWRLVYQVAIYTGLRHGELLALQWGDIELRAGGLITVRRSLSANVTKSCKKRHVPMFDEAYVALVRWRHMWRERFRREPRLTDLVFPKFTDGGMRRDDDDFYWSDAWKPGRRLRNGGRETSTRRPGNKTQAGIERDVRFHDLRHTCASHLVIGDWGRAWTLHEVRDFMGHTAVNVTERYAHLGQEGIRAAARETAARADVRQMLTLIKNPSPSASPSISS
jgi:integrase